MMRSTRHTSTSGVTLMPETMPRRPPPPEPSVPAMLRLRPRVRRLVAGGGRVEAVLVALHLRQDEVADGLRVLLEVLRLLLERVVSDDGRERDQDADRGGDERLGDAAHDVVHAVG